MKKKIDKNEAKERQELINAIINAKLELEVANRNFDALADAQLTDYYSYEIKAKKVKYDYLIKQVKEKGILLDMINELNLRYNSEAI